jgi:hypothetical protein
MQFEISVGIRFAKTLAKYHSQMASGLFVEQVFGE